VARRQQKEGDATSSPLRPTRGSRSPDTTSRRTRAKRPAARTAVSAPHDPAGPRKVAGKQPSPEPDAQPEAQPDERLDVVQQRLERLEEGVRLVAETMKRVIGDLNSSIQQLREDVAMTATAADVERAVGRTATPTDVAHGVSRALGPLVSSLDRLVDVAPAEPSSVLRGAMDRLRDSIEAARSVVDQALSDEAGRQPMEGPADDAHPRPNGSGNGGVDAASIWGTEWPGGPTRSTGSGSGENPGHTQMQHRVAHSWPGRAYANWKYRRT